VIAIVLSLQATGLSTFLHGRRSVAYHFPILPVSRALYRAAQLVGKLTWGRLGVALLADWPLTLRQTAFPVCGSQ
jgi:hypothetical protein